MRVLGIDFTSRPSKRKPITCLNCSFDADQLIAGELELWTDFEGFESALSRSGPWIAGVDLPFGQSRKFIETIGWPEDWREYVQHAQSLGRAGFRAALDGYRKPRAPGDKEHRRATDIAAGSISPQKLYGVPVGLMFFEGAPRLEAADVTIPGLKDGDPERTVVEAYPGVLARQLIGPRSYKQDTKKKQTEAQLHARHDLLDALKSGKVSSLYGFSIDAREELCEEPGGDHLDALLCAVQAAWSWTQREEAFGQPAGVDPLEGWIADPTITKRFSDGGA